MFSPCSQPIEMNFSGFFFHTAVIGTMAVIQSVFLANGIVGGVTPDFALLVLTFSANQQGSLKGQTAGFVTGFVQDVLSITPLGFHAFSRTVIGYLFGAFKGKIFIDPLLIPILLAIVATVIKAVLGFGLLAIFSPGQADVVFSVKLAIELGLNSVAAPFLYGFLRMIKFVKYSRKEQ